MIQCAKCKKHRAGHISTTYLGFRTKICFACATDPKFSRHGWDHELMETIESDATSRNSDVRKGTEFTIPSITRLDGKPYIFIAA